MVSEDEVRNRQSYFDAVFVALVRHRHREIDSLEWDDEVLGSEAFEDVSLAVVKSDMKELCGLVLSEDLSEEVRLSFSEALLAYHVESDFEMFGMDVPESLDRKVESLAEFLVSG